MSDNLEIIVFDLCNIYKSVHESARVVCAERGITLREVDLKFRENEKIATQYGVVPFPQCVFARGSKVIGRTSWAIQTPKTLSTLLDQALLEEAAQDHPPV
ncbi:MAG: hypothetical protein WCP60_11425 [bacterium]